MGKSEVGADGLQLGAHTFKATKNAWWYEEHNGLCIVFSPLKEKTICVTIPWRQIKLAMGRRFGTEEHEIITPRKQFSRFVGYVKTHWTHFVRRRGIASR